MSARRASCARWRMPTNIEHPLMGKTLIAAGMTLFGDDALGWRALSTLAGTAVVVGVFAHPVVAPSGGCGPRSFGSVLTILNFTVFIQARIAMLDGFMAAFVVIGLVTLLWAMRGSRRASLAAMDSWAAFCWASRSGPNGPRCPMLASSSARRSS